MLTYYLGLGSNKQEVRLWKRNWIILNQSWFTSCILSLLHKFILSILSVILRCKSKVFNVFLRIMSTLHLKKQHEPTLFRNRGSVILKRQISKPLLYKHTVWIFCYTSCLFDKCQFSIPRRSVNVQYVYQSLPVSKPSMNLPCHDNDRTRKYRLLSSFWQR